MGHVGVERRTFLSSVGLAGVAVATPGAAAARAKSAPAAPRAGRKSVTTPRDLVVKTTAGPVRGYLNDGIRTFRGVPYAEPPVGPLRFKPPVPPKPWTDVRWALVQGPNCPQHNYREKRDQIGMFVRQRILNEEDEDCLQLNVWTPEINGSGKRPVMLWLHGGAFLNGSAGASPTTDGTNLARRGDVVVVSINHRLNVFGHLDLSRFGPEYADSVNAGSLDMVMALRWVRDNIARFGGDPNNVTIFGQSGGGAKVATLMVMPSARGLFHKACVQSSSSRINSPENAAKLADGLLRAAGITGNNIDKLLEMPQEELLALGTSISAAPLAGGVEWRPAADGKTILQHPFHPVGPKPSADIPLLIGGTRHEFAGTKLIDEQGLQAELDRKFGAKAAELRAFFRRKYPTMAPNEVLALVNVEQYRANHFDCARRKADLGGAGCYAYIFAWKTPQLDEVPLAFHHAEVPFIFGNTQEMAPFTTGSIEAEQVSHQIQDAWLAFARTGNPNHRGMSHWPKFDRAGEQTMIFDVRSETVSKPYADEAAAIRAAMAKA